jgi:hypothetical protein
VCPGVVTGEKLFLNSLAKFTKNKLNKNTAGDLIFQNREGIQTKTKPNLSQLTLIPNHLTFGSNTENKLFII